VIGALKGTVISLTTDNCIIDTAGGAGYRVFMPADQLAEMSLGSSVRLIIHTAVREDAVLLYGFINQEYYDLFELLLTVSGLGPKIALGILSAVKPNSFYLAVRNKNMDLLVSLPGIGKKTAERMVLELKDKVGGIDEKDISAGGQKKYGNESITEAVEALISLGYSNSEIIPVLKKIPDCESLSGEEILRKALRLFAGRK